MATKKDYELVAQAIRDTKEFNSAKQQIRERAAGEDVLDFLTDTLIVRFAEANPDFQARAFRDLT